MKKSIASNASPTTPDEPNTLPGNWPKRTNHDELNRRAPHNKHAQVPVMPAHRNRANDPIGDGNC